MPVGVGDNQALSYLSATCPAMDEKSIKGSINIPAAIVIKNCAFSPDCAARVYVIRITRAFLKTLSLNAPKN